MLHCVTTDYSVAGAFGVTVIVVGNGIGDPS